MSSFRRVLTYVWPHKRYLIPGLILVVFIGISFGATIGSMLPVLKVMISDDGLHGWVEQSITKQRLGATIGEEEGEVVVMTVKPGGPAETSGLKGGDRLFGIVLVRGDRRDRVDLRGRLELYRHLASAGESVILQYRRGGEKVGQAERIQLRSAGWYWRLGHRAVETIPRGQAPAERFRTLLCVLAVVLLIRIVENVARFAQEYLVVLVSLRAVMDMRRQAYEKVLRLPLAYFTRQDGGTSDVMSRFVQDSQAVQRGIKTVFAKTLVEPVKAIGVLCLAVAISWQLTLLAMVLTPVALVLIRKFGKKVRRASRKALKAWSMMLASLEGCLFGIRVVKAFGQEGLERRRLFAIDKKLLAQQMKVTKVDAASGPVLEIMGTLTASVAILVAAWMVIQAKMKPEEFVTLGVCLAAIYDPIRKLSNVWNRIQAATAGADRMFELIDMELEEPTGSDAPPLARLRRQIEFRNVCFRYDGLLKPVLQDINLTVPRGQILAIVGPNGSGKTTLVSLLLRFFEPEGGQILFDDQDISAVRLRSLRDQISLVTQDSVIFADTVRANIGYGKRGATDDEIVEAARKAFADEFIGELPAGYDTMIGEHGATLSGGQCQRLALARAILRDTPILILDEATSQIDADSEQKIQKALDLLMHGRTTFVIAHRFTTITAADQIVVLDAGRIIDQGTHPELAVRCPLYRRLYETQFAAGGGQGAPPSS